MHAEERQRLNPSPSGPMDDSPVSQTELEQALLTFELSATFSQEDLQRRYHDLLITWNPHRYASLTNNPRKYMQMYRKGESMTKDIHAAHHVLAKWLAKQQERPPPGSEGRMADNAGH